MMAQSIKAEHLVDEERRRLMDENSHLLEELKERYDFSNIIGTSGPMRQVYEQIAKSPTPTRPCSFVENQVQEKN